MSREQSRAYYKKHREEVCAKKREYYKLNQEAIRDRRREYYLSTLRSRRLFAKMRNQIYPDKKKTIFTGSDIIHAPDNKAVQIINSILAGTAKLCASA